LPHSSFLAAEKTASSRLFFRHLLRFMRGFLFLRPRFQSKESVPAEKVILVNSLQLGA
jgi:hypothetical protein